MSVLTVKSPVTVVTGNKTLTYAHGLGAEPDWAEVVTSVYATASGQPPVFLLRSKDATAVVFEWLNVGATDSATVVVDAQVNHSAQGNESEQGTLAASGGPGSPIGGGGPGVFPWVYNGNTVGALKSLGTLDAFALPFIVAGLEVARLTTDSRLFINQTAADNGSNAGLQLSSTVANRAQMRGSQYGANTAGGGLSNFKSRALVPQAPLAGADAVLVGDVLRSDSAVGLTQNALVPIAFLQQVPVVQVTGLSVACDWELQLCPLNGATNSRRKVFAVTSEGIVRVRESANTMAGLAVLDAAGQLVIANVNVKATTRFNLTVQDGGAAPTGVVYQSARVVGASFTIKSSAGAADVGVEVYYQLFEQLT